MSGNSVISDKEFHRRVDEILFYLWDPIRLSDNVMCRDEYRNYVPKVTALLLSSDSAAEIAEHLDSICTSSMGLSSKIEHDLKISEILIELKESYES